MFTAEGIRILLSPPRAPWANAIRDRLIGTLRRELLDRLLIVNEQHPRGALTDYLWHYNTARSHRALSPSHRPNPRTDRRNGSTSPNTASTENECSTV
ncbi:MAG: integrase core domain-containing protein [Frankia sp.]